MQNTCVRLIIANLFDMKTLAVCLTPAFFIFCSCNKKTEGPDLSKTSVFDLFHQDSVALLTIETDFKNLFDTKQEEAYQTASLAFTGMDGEEWRKDINVSTRGVTRKKICDFPPLKIAFSKEELASEDLSEYHTLKLVTHCQDSTHNEQLLLKEYLVYRLYNVLTDHSFRTQLAKVKYIDSNDHFPDQEKYAFIIENNKEMAARLSGELLSSKTYQLKAINEENYNLLALFQYMVGNTDWNLSRQHNIKLVLPKEEEIPVAVPYDFDYSGLVNANYAVPHANLPIAHVRERFFQWRGKDPVGLNPAIERLKEKKNQLFEVCRLLPMMEEGHRQDAIAYLESFFSILEDPEGVNKELLSELR